MKRFLSLACSVVALAVVAPAHASFIDASFSGTVDTQTNSTFAVGAAITGEFIYDTAIGRYISFIVGGRSVAPGFSSTASVTPDLYSAIYRAQVSPLTGGTLNSSFVVDLEGLNPWPSANAAALLLNAAQLATNLDTTLSSFGFFTANSDGTNIRAVNAVLTSIRVTAIPEPGSIALLLAGVAAMGLRRRARRDRS